MNKFILLLAFALSVFSTDAMAQERIVLRASDIHPGDYPTVMAVARMGEFLDEWTDGRITIKIYSSGQLGNEKDALQLTIFGGIDITRVSLSPLNSIASETTVLTLPFIFRSVEHMHKVVDGPIGDEVLATLEPHGLIGLTYYDAGARSFYNVKRPIHSPEDMIGLKIRVMNSPLAVAMVEALGANATPMDFGQVYESLVLGAIDGGENNWPSYEMTRHYEPAPYYTLTQHTMVPEVLVMSEHRWQRLTSEDQALVRKAARLSAPYMRELWLTREEEARARVESAGVQIVDNLDKAPFIAAMDPVYEQFVDTDWLRNIVERIRAVE